MFLSGNRRCTLSSCSVSAPCSPRARGSHYGEVTENVVYLNPAAARRVQGEAASTPLGSSPRSADGNSCSRPHARSRSRVRVRAHAQPLREWHGQFALLCSISGSAILPLSFTESHIDDVLKSLSAVDESPNGHISATSSNSPPDYRIRPSNSISVNPAAPMYLLLEAVQALHPALQGASITITRAGGTALSGSCSAVTATPGSRARPDALDGPLPATAVRA